MMTENKEFKSKKVDDGLNLMDFIKIALSNWYWFVLSALICVGYTYYKQKKMPDIYYRHTSILIKDQSNAARTADPTSAFYEMGTLRLMQSSPIENELLIFKSKRLMEEVVEKLNLDIYYSTEGQFRDWDLYHECPVQVSFPEAQGKSSFSFNLVPLNKKEVLITEFSVPTNIKQMKVALNDTVKTPIGKMVVTPSLFYSKDNFGTWYHISKANREGVASRYSGALQINVMSNGSNMINLGISDVSPRRAEDILNTLIDVYNQDAIDDKNRMSINTAEFINERLIIIEQELGGFESLIAAYKSHNRVTDIASQTGSYMETSNKYQQEAMAIENQLTLTQYIKDYLVDPNKFNEFIPSNTGISDVNIEGLIGQYNSLMMQRDKLLSNSSSKNPVVQDLNNSLSALKQTMIRTVDNLITAQNMKLSNIRGEEERVMRRIAAVPTQQKYVLSVERQQKIKESLYIYLLNKREENALTQLMVESNARVIDPAKGSNVPVSPNRQNMLLMSLLLGLAIPAGVLVLIQVLDTKVRTRRDVKKILSVPFLGDIPEHKRERGEAKNSVVVKSDGIDSVTEAFRILRTNMTFMNTEQTPVKCIMVTSLSVGAGKTFISSNLGMTLALTGKNVIIVDLDIRKGSLSSRIRRQGQSHSHSHSHNLGVTNYLSGSVTDINELITESGLHENLSLMASGPIPPNPAELLETHRLNDLIDHLKEKFDYVLLDNVPSNMVADALIVNRLADLTLYIVRAGQTERRQLQEIEQLYVEKKLKNMSIVLNGVKLHKKGYGYYGYYGYGYGYSSSNKKHAK